MKLLPKSRKATKAAYASDDAKWQAVLQKDPRADGCFHFAVKTTGIYCRPSCSAPPALRRNVVFFGSSDAAEQAGFRACKRCQPNGAGLSEEYAATVAKACRAIEEAETPPTLGALAKSCGMSSFHFHRVFRSVIGLTPKGYAVAHRSKKMRAALPTAASVTEAIYHAGFKSNGRFYATSAHTLGMTPTNFRQGGAGTAIRFAVRQCSLGLALVAASEKGVCAILLGDDQEELARELHHRFPKAQIISGDQTFESTVAQVIAFIDAPKTGFNLPLDVRGTVFQQKVWQALREIPLGATLSYSALAARIGAPKAVRAVAGACAANHLAVAIPCHRILRHDGGLSGYRWGVQRKSALLERESSWTPTAATPGTPASPPIRPASARR